MRILFILSILVFAATLHAQSVNTSLTIGESSRLQLELSQPHVVNLYKQFRENKYPILFRFSTTDIKPDAAGQVVVRYQFETSLLYNGKKVAASSRAPMPFFPGDMFMPIETTDIISMLATREDKTKGLPSGKYQLVLTARPVDFKGEAVTAQFAFSIP